MTGLKDRIIAQIGLTGPISVSEYMTLCLSDPRYGYYMRRDPFGADGDFTTAPEISQLFGELVGVWLCAAWRAIGSPLPVSIAEIGPGRGTMMKDVLRAIGAVDRRLHDGAGFVLIETSPRLIEMQKSTLIDAPVPLRWCEHVNFLAGQPLLIVGNELFDALPIRQFVKLEEKWKERLITVNDDGELVFAAGTIEPDIGPHTSGLDLAPQGTILELSPQRYALMEEISQHIAANSGAGLFFDYGSLQPGTGDTLQAVRAHRFEDIFVSPGNADLTSHVDFAVLAAAARNHGLATHTQTQGAFLLAMGLLERAGKLGADANEELRTDIRSAVDRLAGEQQMGDLFKVLAICNPQHRLPPFAASD